MGGLSEVAHGGLEGNVPLAHSLFLIGVAALAWFVAGLFTGWSYEKEEIEPR